MTSRTNPGTIPSLLLPALCLLLFFAITGGVLIGFDYHHYTKKLTEIEKEAGAKWAALLEG